VSDAAAFSFYPTVLGAYGDGGIVVTSDEAVERQLRAATMGWKIGTTSFRRDSTRASEVRRDLIDQAARDATSNGAELAARYQEAARVDTSSEGGGVVTCTTCTSRDIKGDVIMERLRERQISLNVSYRWPVHTMAGFAHLGYRISDLPHTELAADQIFSLPMFYPWPTRHDVVRRPLGNHRSAVAPLSRAVGASIIFTSGT
jgi:aminotransferase EvaB